MHPALHSWRDELPSTLIRTLAYLGAAAMLSIAAAQFFQSTTFRNALVPTPRDPWITIRKPFPAFTLSIPEAASAPDHYAIRRNVEGGGRQDILSLGEPDSVEPYLQVEIYRPGKEIARFGAPESEIVAAAAGLGPAQISRGEPLETKFGPLAIVTFETTTGVPRHCLGFVWQYDDPRLQISGRFCRGGEFIDRSTLACALDRLTLLSAGSEPKVGTLFARAELRRGFCLQHDPILTPTPKYQLLWKALANRPEPRRIGR